ncbi:MAG TPA: zinc ribbon domain-containing protein [Burkholderiales bacterium]|nr:zinc ribbon domain-containing protein [Burkholderiales bacterium]
MPIYEYRCSSCGFQKEYLRKVSDPLLRVCPECSKETFGKMLTAAGFQLKGGGWYATDFKNSGAKPASKADSKSGTASEGKSEGKGKGESKSESKTEAPPAAAAAPAASASAAKAE